MKKKTILVAAIAVMLVAALVVGGTLAYFTDKSDAKVNTFTVGNVKINLTETAWHDNDDHTLVPNKFYDKNPTITVDAKSQDAYVFLKLDLNKYVSLINLMGVDAYKNNIGGLGDPNGPYYPTYPTYPGFIRFVEMLAKDNALRADVLDRWFKGINHAEWKVMNTDQIEAAVVAAQNGQNPKNLVVVLGYQKNGGIVKAGTEVKFMDKFGMPDTVTASMFNGEDAYYVGEGVDRHSASNFNTASGDFKMIFTAYAIQASEIKGLDAAYTALGGYDAFVQ